MGNSIMSHTRSAFNHELVRLPHMTSQHYIEYHFQAPCEPFPQGQQPIRRITETERCACKILPMTSTCGQGNFSVKLGQSRKWGKFKGWSVCSDCDFSEMLREKNVVWRLGMPNAWHSDRTLNRWSREQLDCCYYCREGTRFILGALHSCTVTKVRPHF